MDQATVKNKLPEIREFVTRARIVAKRTYRRLAATPNCLKMTVSNEILDKRMSIP